MAVDILEENDRDGRESTQLIKPANCVKSFTLMGSESDSVESMYGWISYIGEKYHPTIEALDLYFNSDLTDYNMIQSLMVNTISRLTHLKYYKGDCYPYLSKEMVQALEESGAKLNTPGFFWEVQGQMQQGYENLVSSTTFLATQKQSLEKIYIEDQDCSSGIIKLNDLSQHLPQLTSLELDGIFRVGFTICIL